MCLVSGRGVLKGLVSMGRVYNFSAGPAVLPEEVLQVFLAVEILRNQKEKNSSRTDEDRAIIGKIP